MLELVEKGKRARLAFSSQEQRKPRKPSVTV